MFLNGCHTTEHTTSRLSNFVDAFINRAGASAVIGTETTIEQGVAGWAGHRILEHLLHTDDLGTALRTMRWALINRGNTIGLSYTLNGLAGLRLRPTGTRPHPTEEPHT